MSSDMQRKVLIALAVVLVGLGLWWFYFYLEWESKEINRGYGKQASKNKFLAAQLFLESQKIPSEQGIQINKLDNIYHPDGQFDEQGEIGIEDTIFVINGRGVFNGRRFDNVFDWVQDGGHLITTLENPFLDGADYRDALFAELGIYFDDEEEGEFFNDIFGEGSDEDSGEDSAYNDEYDEGEENSDEGQTSEQANDIIGASESSEAEEDEWVWVDSDNCYDYASAELTLHDSREVLNVDMGRGGNFYYENYHADWEAVQFDNENTDIVGASFAIGNGRISIVSDAQFLNNRYIQCHDHAYLLWRLVNPNGKVWFFENLDAPSLFSMSLRHLPYASLAVLIAIVFSVWSWLTRFGPIFAVKKIERRSFAEHIRANAMFMWRKSQYVALISPLRRSVEKLMSRRVLGFDQLDRREKIEHVSSHTQVPAEYIEPALFKSEIETLSEFIEFVRTLKHIKDQL